jgi:hypothetical protein
VTAPLTCKRCGRPITAEEIDLYVRLCERAGRGLATRGGPNHCTECVLALILAMSDDEEERA